MKKKLLALLMVFFLAVGCETITDSSKDSSSSVDNTSSEETSTVEETSSVEETVTVSITTEDFELWYDETIQLEVELSKEVDLEFNWTSSDEEVATVNEEGFVTALKGGKTTITVTALEDETITDAVEVTIKDVVIDTNYGFGNYDYANLKSENPTIATTKVNAEWPYAEAIFKNVYGQKYYAEATFNVTEINYGWVWNRISVGHRDKTEVDADHIFRGLQLSYGDSSGNQKKTVMMETPNNWGVVTDRSQVWGLNGLSDIDFTNVKLATLRDGNTYYYFINDMLHWVELFDARFEGTDTMPTIVVHDMHATISNLYATEDATVIDTKLDEAQTKRRLYPTIANNVVISENDTKIQFVNNNNAWPFTNIKDNRAVSLGDAFSMIANANSVVEFDLVFDEFGDNDSALFGVTLHRWQDGPNNERTIAIQKYISVLISCDSNGDMPNSLTAQAVEFGIDEVLSASTDYHVVVERAITDDTQTFSLKINDVSYTIDFNEKYVGPMTLSFGCIFANATVTNLSVSSLV